MQFVKFSIVLAFLLVASSFVFADVQESINTAGDALSRNDLATFFSASWSALSESAAGLQVLRIVAVLLGLVIIVLIVLRLSAMLNRPKIKNSELKKVKEDKEFLELAETKEDVLEQLKHELSKED